MCDPGLKASQTHRQDFELQYTSHSDQENQAPEKETPPAKRPSLAERRQAPCFGFAEEQASGSRSAWIFQARARWRGRVQGLEEGLMVAVLDAIWPEDEGSGF